VSDVDNEGPRVSPIGRTATEEPRRHAAAGVVAVVVAGIVALVFMVGPDVDSGVTSESTSTLIVSEPSAVTSDLAPTSTAPVSTSSTPPNSVRGQTLHDVLPEATGVLVAAITTRAWPGMELVRWPPATPSRSSEIPMLSGPVLDFDASGQHMAFLGPSATVEGPTLYLGRLDSWAPVRVGVSSFRWHAILPGRIGWMEPGDTPRLCWADADSAEGFSAAVCVSGTGMQLVGFDSSGFLVVDYASRTVDRLDATGRPVASLPGTNALVGPDGQVLIVDQNPDARGSSFSLADPNLTEAVELDWAPRNASGEYGFVAWSPVRHPPELAFLIYEGGEGQLQRWGLDGTPRRPVNLSGRVWDVEWDSTGRYLLIPGVLDESDHVLQVYDTISQALISFYFDNWIQDAHLVTPAVCQDAAHVTATFADRLPAGVNLETPQMVFSRDPSLDSWYFTSAVIDGGGPFDGEVASWAHPAFDGISVDTNTPNLSIPINGAARSLGFGMVLLDPVDYGVDDWLKLDGAFMSQQCVLAADPSR